MKKWPRKIKLAKGDCALVVRSNLKREVYIAHDGDEDETVSDAAMEISAAAIILSGTPETNRILKQAREFLFAQAKIP